MSKFFINRPIVAIVISILMVLAGVVSMLSLPTAQFPNIADPQIQLLPATRAPTQIPWRNRWPRPSSSRCPASTA